MIARSVAQRTWEPGLGNDRLAGSNQNIIVCGPHLIYKASSGGGVRLFGGADSEATSTTHAPSKIRDFSWNGKKVLRAD